MLDYKKILAEDNFDDAKLEIDQSEIDRRVEIGGNKKGLLYFACRVMEFVEDTSDDCYIAERNFDSGVGLINGPSSLCVYIYNDKANNKE